MAEATESIGLSSEEQALLSRHLNFYQSLATGRRKPGTIAQKHFVEVALGHAGAETPHEFAYIKYVRLLRSSTETESHARDPELEGPADGWFTREDWKKSRGRQRWDGVR